MTITMYKGDLPKNLDFGDSVAIDTETLGLIPERDPLCLIQLSSGDGTAHLLQFDRSNYDAPNLKSILEDININKLFHYARADLLFIKKHLGVDVKSINCTKIMSKIARGYTDKHGLKDLIKEFIGIDISKQLQSSDFGGELSDKQLKYCAQDVIYLHKIYDSLNKILEREKRINLYDKTIKFINTRVELDLASFKEDIWSH